MNFLKGIYRFVKSLVVGFYQHTVGDVVNLVTAVTNGKSPRGHMKGTMRVIQFVFLTAVMAFFPTSIVLVSIARSLVAVDIVGAIALTMFDLADQYAVEHPVPAAV